MNFEFATATRIVFGPGAVKNVPALAAEMGARPFVVTGSSSLRSKPLLDELRGLGMCPLVYEMPGEPTTKQVCEATGLAREASRDLVIGIGGGSALDAGKAVAALLTNGGEIEDYLEVIGKGQPLRREPAPYIAIPTTAGTGAEVTRNAVLGAPEHRVKVSMRSPMMLPRLAVVDPELTYVMPPSVTASTGLDALSQLLEVFVCNQANPLTDGVCREGLRRAGRSLRIAFEKGGAEKMDESLRAAREDMAVAGLFGGLALANAKLGAIHGFAGPLGGMYPMPHGIVCARLLPHVVEVNARALAEREPTSPIFKRFDELARILTGSASASAADGVAWLAELCETLQVSPLANFGLKQEDFPTVIEKARKASSMKGNPIALTGEELGEIIGKAL